MVVQAENYQHLDEISAQYEQAKTRLKAAELNARLLQIVLSRLERQDPELQTKLKRLQEEYRYSYEGSNLPELLRKYFPEEFPPDSDSPL